MNLSDQRDEIDRKIKAGMASADAGRMYSMEEIRAYMAEFKKKVLEERKSAAKPKGR